MIARNSRVFTILAFNVLALCACASNIAVYEPPTSGLLSNITFVNSAENQEVRLATFDDAHACTRKRHIHFKSKDGIPAGKSRSLVVAAGSEFALFARMDTLESDDYEIEIGMTGGGPAPLRRRTATAIGCTAQLSFRPEPDKAYRVEISEPVATNSCSVDISETGAEGQRVAVETNTRIPRSSRDALGSFCEPPER